MMRLIRRLFHRHELIDHSTQQITALELPSYDDDAKAVEGLGARMHAQSHRLHVLQWQVDRSSALKSDQKPDEPQPRPTLVALRGQARQG